MERTSGRRFAPANPCRVLPGFWPAVFRRMPQCIRGGRVSWTSAACGGRNPRRSAHHLRCKERARALIACFFRDIPSVFRVSRTSHGVKIAVTPIDWAVQRPVSRRAESYVRSSATMACSTPSWPNRSLCRSPWRPRRKSSAGRQQTPRAPSSWKPPSADAGRRFSPVPDGKQGPDGETIHTRAASG
jgi:hypothetical protein